MIAKVTLLLNGITYCIKGELIRLVTQTNKLTVFQQSGKTLDSEGKEIVRYTDFRVASDLVGLYFR